MMRALSSMLPVVAVLVLAGCRTGQTYVVKVAEASLNRYDTVAVPDFAAEAGADPARTAVADALARYLERGGRFGTVMRVRDNFEPGAGSVLLASGRIVELNSADGVVKVKMTLMDATARTPLAEADFEATVSLLSMDSAYNHIAGMVYDYMKQVHVPARSAGKGRSESAPRPAPMPVGHGGGNHVLVPAAELKWAPNPVLPPGAMSTVVDGNPKEPGAYYIIRAKLPDGFKVPPHRHPSDENVTVLQGTLMIGLGEKFDAAALKELPAGTFARMPKGMPHFAMAKGETIVQVHGIGPFDFLYVNPAEDPRTAKPAHGTPQP
jgi:hypothetical protein